MVVMILGCGVWRTIGLIRCTPEMTLVERAAKASAQTEPNSFILLPREIPMRHWFAYLAWRPCLSNPLPASEDRTRLFQALRVFKSGNRAEALRWLDENHYRGYLIVLKKDGMPELLALQVGKVFR